MAYSVPQHIDPNQIFLVNFSELEGRWDAYYNQPKYFHLEKQLTGLNCPMSNLKSESIKIFSGLTPLSGGDSYVQSGGIYFLRSGDYKEDNTIDFNSVIQISPDTHNGLMKNSKLQYGDVLIAIVGATIGKIGVYCYDYESNVNQAICAVRLKNNLNPLFVQCFYQTSIGQQLLNRIKRPVARANINLDEIGQLPIPLVSKQNQETILAVMTDAYKCRNKKLALSKQKLASIDEYLLGELGVTLPKDDFQELNDRIFAVRFKEVMGNRFDPKSYCKKKNNLLDAIQKTSYDKYPLITFIENECSGEWGEDVEETKLDMSQYTKCLVLRSTEFDNRYNLRLDNSRVKYRYILNSKLNKMDVKPFDLIVEKSGGSEDQPVGRIAILTEDVLKNNNIAYSNFLQKISVVGINPYYLYYYLKVMHNIGMTDFMQSQTNGIRNLIMSEYKKQIVITPAEDKQAEIVAHISAIRAEAKTLEVQAEEVLTKAREEVERMIMNKA